MHLIIGNTAVGKTQATEAAFLSFLTGLFCGAFAAHYPSCCHPSLVQPNTHGQRLLIYIYIYYLILIIVWIHIILWNNMSQYEKHLRKINKLILKIRKLFPNSNFFLLFSMIFAIPFIYYIEWSLILAKFSTPF